MLLTMKLFWIPDKCLILLKNGTLDNESELNPCDSNQIDFTVLCHPICFTVEATNDSIEGSVETSIYH